MNIVDFLKRENCVASLSSDNKEDALKELCDLLSANGAIGDGEEVFEAVMNRERLGSTGIGGNVAIPHAKSAGVDSLTAAFGFSKDGVEYHAVDNKPVHLIFLIVASGDATGNHLKALARISRLLKREDFRKEIERKTNADEIYEVMKKEDANLG